MMVSFFCWCPRSRPFGTIIICIWCQEQLSRTRTVPVEEWVQWTVTGPSDLLFRALTVEAVEVRVPRLSYTLYVQYTWYIIDTCTCICIYIYIYIHNTSVYVHTHVYVYRYVYVHKWYTTFSFFSPSRSCSSFAASWACRQFCSNTKAFQRTAGNGSQARSDGFAIDPWTLGDSCDCHPAVSSRRETRLFGTEVFVQVSILCIWNWNTVSCLHLTLATSVSENWHSVDPVVHKLYMISQY